MILEKVVDLEKGVNLEKSCESGEVCESGDGCASGEGCGSRERLWIWRKDVDLEKAVEYAKGHVDNESDIIGFVSNRRKWTFGLAKWCRCRGKWI